MSVKILAFDLDYTLLNDKKLIPPENFEALSNAAAKGVYIVPATGRVHRPWTFLHTATALTASTTATRTTGAIWRRTCSRSPRTSFPTPL